jgi:type II secretory pathway component PulM
MGEWKAPLSLRISRELRAELEQLAARERRTLGNVGELLLEWGAQQLKAAGSMERLLKSKASLPGRRVRLTGA